MKTIISIVLLVIVAGCLFFYFKDKIINPDPAVISVEYAYVK